MFWFRNKASFATAIKASLLSTASLACCAFLSGCSETPAPQADMRLESAASIDNPFRDLNSFFDCLEEQEIPLISAHRGGSPENSLIGAQRTLSQIPAILEVDVATSRDGVLFLMHDDTLNRTTEGTGEIENRGWDYIKKQRLLEENGTPIDAFPPTLAEMLVWAEGRTILQIDFKRTTRFEDVISQVKAADATNRVIYIAYSEGQARKLHRLHPDAMISVSLSSQDDLDSAERAGIPAKNMLGWTGNEAPNETLFRLLNDRDIEVIFGTLGGRNSIDNKIEASGDETRYAKIERQGVDIIATDRPVDAFQALKRAGRALDYPACGVYPAAG